MNKIRKISRRAFLQTTSAVFVSGKLMADLPGDQMSGPSSRIIRVHNSKATKPWDYSANEPWDHTVEPGDGNPGKIEERYYDYINEDVVADMLDRGLRELTDTGSTAEAWRTLLPDFNIKDKIAIKMNMNNASWDEKVTTNRMDQTMPIVNALLDGLVNGLGLPEEQLILLDASRWFHPVIVKGRCKFPKVSWVDHSAGNLWDRGEEVTFTKDQPLPGGDFWMPKAYTGSDHIINLCLMKNHGCGITGAMKNHFGSIPSPKCLHEGLGDKSYIADLCNTPSIRDKVRLNIADALFANWHNNVWAPRAWNTFPEESPNSLILGTDPVALDSVMLDHITEEIEARGDRVPDWVRDCVNHHEFLEYAMDHHNLGIHEHKPYKRIDYRTMET
jgi:Domain of unknown function (DUF362)